MDTVDCSTADRLYPEVQLMELLLDVVLSRDALERGLEVAGPLWSFRQQEKYSL